ncbi:hypothetical protein, partial [Escherichia coli]|uniref:hypothetical protein n=1 Tax=Escherichia coli TaxID=562 RepID=UPI00215B3283
SPLSFDTSISRGTTRTFCTWWSLETWEDQSSPEPKDRYQQDQTSHSTKSDDELEVVHIIEQVEQ